MNIFKRLYNWAAAEIQMIYQDFSEGYVDSQEDLMDIVTIGLIIAMLAVVFMWFTGTGDMGL